MPETKEALHLERTQLLAIAERETRIAEHTPEDENLAEQHFMAAGYAAQRAREIEDQLSA